MRKWFHSKILSRPLWASSILVVGVGTYFLGQRAEAVYENLITDKTPSLDMLLEAQGRYEEAIQVVLTPSRERPVQSGDYLRAASLYLEMGKRDVENRTKLAEKSAFYTDKSAELDPNDPFTLDSAMTNLDRAGDYSQNGCPYYEKAEKFGEKAIVLYHGSSAEGRKYPTQQMTDLVEPELNRIRVKIEAWCRKAPQ
jgi:tetratricopeptide (TPR) repeat protein